MTKNQKKYVAIAGATAFNLLLPLMTFAQASPYGTCTGAIPDGIATVICTIYHIITIVIPVLILGAVAYFIWGIVQFITAHDAEEKGEARGAMVHGIIGFAVILGLWGLVKILLHTFNLDNTSGPGALPIF